MLAGGLGSTAGASVVDEHATSMPEATDEKSARATTAEREPRIMGESIHPTPQKSFYAPSLSRLAGPRAFRKWPQAVALRGISWTTSWAAFSAARELFGPTKT
jgi:hypothetical protein